MSKSKHFITTSAVILSMATPVVGTVSNLGTVFAEDNSTSSTSSESVDAKLQRATDVRDVAHKEFVDATVEYTLANRVKTATDADKKTAEDNLSAHIHKRLPGHPSSLQLQQLQYQGQPLPGRKQLLQLHELA